MKTALCFCIGLTFISTQAGTYHEPDDRRIQGQWRIVSMDNEDSPSDDWGQFIFTGDKYVVTISGKIMERGTFKLDSAVTPRRIDVSVEEPAAFGTLLGIYEFEGNRLNLHACGRDADVARPASFEPHFRCKRILLERNNPIS